MSNSLRHFSFYTADCKMTLRLAGYTYTIEHSVDFACAFCLRQLRACVRPFRMFPARFCKLDLDIRFVGDCPKDYDTSAMNRLCLHNYQQVEDAVIRGCLFALSVDYMCSIYS